MNRKRYPDEIPATILLEARVRNEYLTLSASLMALEDGKVRNLRGALEGIALRAQANSDPAETTLPASYAWELGILRAYEALELSDVREVASYLAKVERKLDALTRQLGPCETFGQYVARFAVAAGVTILVYVGEPTGWYPDSSFRELSGSEAIDWVDARIKSFHETRR